MKCFSCLFIVLLLLITAHSNTDVSRVPDFSKALGKLVLDTSIISTYDNDNWRINFLYTYHYNNQFLVDSIVRFRYWDSTFEKYTVAKYYYSSQWLIDSINIFGNFRREIIERQRYRYDDSGNLIFHGHYWTNTPDNNIKENFEYDSLNRVVFADFYEYYAVGTTKWEITDEYEYTYNPAGSFEHEKNSVFTKSGVVWDTRNIDYQYDSLNSIIVKNVDYENNKSSDTLYNYAYVYDARGNKLETIIKIQKIFTSLVNKYKIIREYHEYDSVTLTEDYIWNDTASDWETKNAWHRKMEYKFDNNKLCLEKIVNIRDSINGGWKGFRKDEYKYNEHITQINPVSIGPVKRIKHRIKNFILFVSGRTAVHIYNLQGKLVYTCNKYSKKEQKIDLSQLLQGMFIVKIVNLDSNDSFQLKFIKP